MEQMKKNDLQFIINAIDTHVRANGLNVAALGAVLAQKVQNMINAMPDDPATPEGKSPGD